MIYWKENELAIRRVGTVILKTSFGVHRVGAIVWDSDRLIVGSRFLSSFYVLRDSIENAVQSCAELCCPGIPWVLLRPVLVFLWVPFYAGVPLLVEAGCYIFRTRRGCRQQGSCNESLSRWRR